MGYLKRLLLGALLLLSAASAGVVWLAWRALPEDGEVLALTGLAEPVTVRYDHARRPFVEADSLEDALFVQGWLHARERLWQMELLRRAGSGRLAEGLGGSMLDSDRALWRAGVPQLAQVLDHNASGFLRTQIDRYVSGINAALAEQRGRPVEFLITGIEVRPWTPADVFAVAAITAFQSAGNQDNEMLRLALQGALDADHFAWLLPAGAVPPEPAPALVDWGGDDGTLLARLDALSTLDAVLLPGGALGSNGWVVGASRSAGGRPLFAFDSHDDLSLPNLFYEVHLFFPPDRQLRGWSLPGLPGVVNGYNQSIAWGLTNIGDTQDLFLETLHPDDAGQVLGPDGWYAVTREEVLLPVARRDEPDRLIIRRTRNGPLVSDDPPLALRWSGHHVGGLGMDAFLLMNLADDWPTFQRALDRLPVPSANVTYADRHGTIAARTVGLLPLRRRGDGLMPRPGHDPAWDWDGFVPTAALPALVNPPAGYVAAANVPLPVAGAPLVSADHAPGYRVERLHAVLGADAARSLDAEQALQLDWVNGQAQRLLPGLLTDMDREALSRFERRALAVLEAWAEAPVNAPDAAGALLYEHWYVALAQELFGAALAKPLLRRLLANNYVLNQGLDRVLLDDGGSPWWRGDRAGRLAAAFAVAAARVAERHGDDAAGWRWDAALTVEVHHELSGAVPLLSAWLDRGPYAWGGGPATVGRARFRYHRPFEVRSAATARVVAELSDPIRVRAIMPGGQSGHPASGQYADQLPRWLAGELDALPARWPESPARIMRLLPGPARPAP